MNTLPTATGERIIRPGIHPINHRPPPRKPNPMTTPSTTSENRRIPPADTPYGRDSLGGEFEDAGA